MTIEINRIEKDIKTETDEAETPLLIETAKNDQDQASIAAMKKNLKIRLVLTKSCLSICRSLLMNRTLNKI